MTTRYLRCKESHSTYKKVLKLIALAEDLGISIEFSYDKFYLNDKDKDCTFEFVGVDDYNDTICSFPPDVDFKLIFENQAYLKEISDKQKARDNKVNLKCFWKKSRKGFILAEIRSAEENKRKAKELAERKLLAELKAKYE